MPNILFASNSVSHFPGSELGASYYDADRVPYSIETPLETPVSSPDIPETTTDETWFHFRHTSNNFYLNNDEPIMQVTDDLGNTILSLTYYNRGGEGYHLRSYVDGNNFVNSKYYPNPEGRIRTYDIMLRQTALNCRIEVYMNEILVEVQDYAISSFRPVKNLILGGTFGNNGTGQGFYSEIIVADGDTRNARLDLLRPQSVGVYSDWLGPVSSLSDDDPTTGMTTTQNSQKQSTILTPYGGAENISNIVQTTTSVRGVNSPDQLRHLIRMSGVDYFSSDFDLPFEKAYQTTDWTLNPATSLPWTADDLATIEFGFESDSA